MANDHERDGDGMMLSCLHSPHKVLHHGVVLVPTSAVVSMQGALAPFLTSEA